MRKLLLGLLFLLVGAGTATWAYAPYLPQLIAEGVPPLTWPAVGHFAPLAGDDKAPGLSLSPEAATRPLVPELGAAFAATGGKALLVARDGRLELEHYAPGISDATRFNSFSMAKTLVGALVYKALAEGRISSLDQTLGELLPADRGLAGVTLRSLLEMRSGIAFDHGEAKADAISGDKTTDTSANPFGPLARLHFLGLGAIENGLVAEVATTPAEFSYQNINTALLGEVLETVYGEPLATLLTTRIWGPSGAGSAFWRQPAADASVSAYCCIYATARDWIRIGMFLAGNGRPEAPFLPDALWRAFLGLDIGYAERRDDNYGHHIRQNVLDRAGQPLQGPFSYLMGQGGQVLYLMPDKGLVVYRSGEQAQLLHSTLYRAWNSIYAP
ncbi:serine hydrolase [Devosia sp. ZB163]|uniref:serine hydrolase domain-containing protein n=1 Tax=Devosia sp. ZB163 TaxID=3025938 RepID=UPI00235DED0D|nr:serine hydrolase [Devosia sp. ZB163]MDC9822384.1 serine hydrolase [Devosia sp. ZB163]